MRSSMPSPPLHALVTGGNRGIGRQIVELILANAPGSRVYLGSRDLQLGNKAAGEINQALEPADGLVIPVHLDVRSEPSVRAAEALISSQVGYLDLLCNNAGIFHENPCAAKSLETLQINFDGAVLVTTVFLPIMREGGNILFTSSGAGARILRSLSPDDRSALLSPALEETGLRFELLRMVMDRESNPEHPYQSTTSFAYGISKLGVNLYTQMLARLHPALFINAATPGLTNTNMCASYSGTRVLKEASLGASVFEKILFSGLGRGCSGIFFKEASTPGTPIELATSIVVPWEQ